MRRLLISLACSTAAVSFLVGCSPQPGIALDSTPEGEPATKAPDVSPVKPEKEVFIFRARYYHTKGPCIQIGNDIAMPVVDAFEVIEVVQGDLHAETIKVQPLSAGGSGYPKELVEGKTYTLRLTPSERTKEQLRENQQKGYSWIWADGHEIEEQKAGK
jgi:hypothetical protein